MTVYPEVHNNSPRCLEGSLYMHGFFVYKKKFELTFEILKYFDEYLHADDFKLLVKKFH